MREYYFCLDENGSKVIPQKGSKIHVIDKDQEYEAIITKVIPHPVLHNNWIVQVQKT